jgi:hypothetical protein
VDDKTFYTLIVTVLLALLGIGAKYWNDLRIAQRKDQLERVNLQLRDLYGPLYALDQAGLEAWRAFRTRVRPGGPFFDSTNPPSKADLAAWRLWMTEVFMPLNLRMETIITANTHLVIEGAMPSSFKDFIAHVSAYKPVIKGWSQGDASEHLSVVPYPTAIRQYVADSYFSLIRTQQRLLGLVARGV